MSVGGNNALSQYVCNATASQFADEIEDSATESEIEE